MNQPAFSSPTVKSRLKLPILVIGDVVIYYCALILMLFIRYGEIDIKGEVFYIHVIPFTVALLVWLLTFYIGGLYERIILKNGPVLQGRLFSLVGIGAVILIALFYFVDSFEITPKVNLFLFTGIFAVSGYAWRYSFNSLLKLRSGSKRTRLLLIGSNEAALEIGKHIAANPQLGYEIAIWMKNGLRAEDKDPKEFAKSIAEQDIHIIVIPQHMQHDSTTLRLLYHNFMSGVEVISIADFYEQLFDKVSLAELEDAWLITHLPRVARTYQLFKYIFEVFLALLILIIASPLMLIAIVAIKLSSAGPILYRQRRVGRNEEIFNVYKFRSMYADTTKNPDALSNSPTWSSSKDERVTPVGKVLRATHLDELPQLFNVLSGHMSFIGPRPERPEFTKELEKKIPYYELRFLLKPGITGWAQINYPYGSSVEDAYQKLQYEIYYLKNRSLTLDVQIFIKTIKRLFVNA